MKNIFKLFEFDYTKMPKKFGRFLYLSNFKRVNSVWYVYFGSQSGGKTYAMVRKIREYIKKGCPKIFIVHFAFNEKTEHQKNSFFCRFLHYIGFLPFLREFGNGIVERIDINRSDDETPVFERLKNEGNCIVVWDEPLGMSSDDKRLQYQTMLLQLFKRGVSVFLSVPHPMVINKKLRPSVTAFIQTKSLSLKTLTFAFAHHYYSLSVSPDMSLNEEPDKKKFILFNPFVAKLYDTTSLVRMNNDDINYSAPKLFVYSCKYINAFYRGSYTRRFLFLFYTSFLRFIVFLFLIISVWISFALPLQYYYKPDCVLEKVDNVVLRVFTCSKKNNSKSVRHSYYAEYGKDIKIVNLFKHRLFYFLDNV